MWWKWTPTAADLSAGSVFTFDTTGSDSFTTLGVFTGPSVDSLSPVTSDADASTGTLETRGSFFTAVADTTYYIQVGVDPDGVEGAVTLSWAPNAVENDDFADALTLPGDEGLTTGWNVDATLEPPDEPVPPGLLGDTVWFSWTPSVSGPAHVALDTDFAIAPDQRLHGERVYLASLVRVGGTSFDAVADTTSPRAGRNQRQPGDVRALLVHERLVRPRRGAHGARGIGDRVE